MAKIPFSYDCRFGEFLSGTENQIKNLTPRCKNFPHLIIVWHQKLKKVKKKWAVFAHFLSSKLALPEFLFCFCFSTFDAKLRRHFY